MLKEAKVRTCCVMNDCRLWGQHETRPRTRRVLLPHLLSCMYVSYITQAVEVSELTRRLRAEHDVRKACERWLRSELRSREEVEALVLAARDLGQQDGGEDARHGSSSALSSPIGLLACEHMAEKRRRSFVWAKQTLKGSERDRLKRELSATKGALRARLLLAD